MKVNVIVVNWNSSAGLARCLESVLSSEGCAVFVVVVDNGSREEELHALDELEKRFGDGRLVIVRVGANHGYAGGNNIGYRYLVERKLPGSVLILNPDTTVARNTVAIMAQALEEDVGIVTPRVVSPRGEILFDGICMEGYRQKYVIGARGTPVSTDVAQGCCMLINRKMPDQIGLFDERFFLYWEETDLSLRAKRSGFRIVVANFAQVTRESNSLEGLPTSFYYSVRNAMLMLEKHPDQFTRPGYFWYVVRVGTWAYKLLGHPILLKKAVIGIMNGVRDGLKKSYGYKMPSNPQGSDPTRTHCK